MTHNKIQEPFVSTSTVPGTCVYINLFVFLGSLFIYLYFVLCTLYTFLHLKIED